MHNNWDIGSSKIVSEKFPIYFIPSFSTWWFMKLPSKTIFYNLFLCIAILNSLFVFKLLKSTAEEITQTFFISMCLEYCFHLLIFCNMFKVYSEVETSSNHNTITHKDLYNIMRQMKSCISIWKFIITTAISTTHLKTIKVQYRTGRLRFPTRTMLFVRFYLIKKSIMENLPFIKNKHSFRSCKGW